MGGFLKKVGLKKIAIGFFFILITLAFLEVGVRTIAHTAFPLLRTDPEVGSIMVKNYSGYAWDELSHRKNYIRTNSVGYVGEDVTLMKPTSTIRIAMLGDSGIAALQVDYRKNFVHLLEQHLNASSTCGAYPRQYEVMNFGIGSAGTFTEYQTYKKKIAQFKPDLVIVMFDNDYDDNIIKSGYDLEHYSLERKSVGIKSFLLQFTLPKFLYSKLIGNQSFISLLHAVGILEGNNALKESPESPIVAATTTVPTATASSSKYYTYTFDILSKFRTLVEHDGAKFSVVIFPNETLDYTHDGDWKSDPHVAYMNEFLSREKFSTMDPSQALYKVKRTVTGCLSFDCGSHFTEVGHQIFADILYPYVAKELSLGVTCAPR